MYTINFTRYDQYSVKYLSSRFLSKTVYISGDVSIIHGQWGVSKYSFNQTQSNRSYQIFKMIMITEIQYVKGYYYKKFQKVEIRYESKQNNFQIQVLYLNMCI